MVRRQQTRTDATPDLDVRMACGFEKAIGANNVTVAGVPAKIVGDSPCQEPSRTMDQMIPG